MHINTQCMNILDTTFRLMALDRYPKGMDAFFRLIGYLSKGNRRSQKLSRLGDKCFHFNAFLFDIMPRFPSWSL